MLAAEPDQEEADDDATCPVCLDPISEARTLDCPNGHTFCRPCLRRVYEHSCPRVLACPLCRTVIDPAILKLRYLRPPRGGGIVTLRIGNTHVALDDPADDAHAWECYVDVVGIGLSKRRGQLPAEALVSAVIFDLHPTFETPRVSVSACDSVCTASEGGGFARRRFGVARSGWGTFVVRITVLFCGSYRVKFKHLLSFDGDGSGSMQEHRVAIYPKVLAAVERLQRLSRPLVSRPLVSRPPPSSVEEPPAAARSRAAANLVVWR